MPTLNRCQKCGGKPIINTVNKVGVPSGDNGYQTTIVCLDCGYRQTKWALRRIWVVSTAIEAWNKRVGDTDDK